MSEIEIVFVFNGANTTVQCRTDEKMKDIFEKFQKKTEKNLNNLLFLYNGNKIEENLKFEEIVKNENSVNDKINILVYDMNSIIENDKIIKSKTIVCKECKEQILIKFEDYKINMYKCKNGHSIEKIKINELEETQMINISKIKCDNCPNNNKGNVFNNNFYRCITCNKNLCPSCRSNHNKNDKIINYDDINYICNKHNAEYSKYCKNCNKNICIRCENEHNGHDKIYFGDILPSENNHLNELKENIGYLENNIKNITKMLEDLLLNIKKYYEISYENINNYKNNNKINYQLLNNINEFINNNNLLLNSIKKAINEKDISNRVKNLKKIYNKMIYKNNPSRGGSSLKMARRELIKFNKLHPSKCSVCPIEDDDIYNWKATIIGPDDSPFKGGIFFAHIFFPSDYPFKPPTLKFKTPIYHPNISRSGYIGLDILEGAWTPGLSIDQIFLSISSLLRNPDTNRPENDVIMNIYNKNRKQYETTAKEWTEKYACFN